MVNWTPRYLEPSKDMTASAQLEFLRDNIVINFGKFKDELIACADYSWLMWWLNKREHDEVNGSTEISDDHKVHAERCYPFRCYHVVFVYSLIEGGFETKPYGHFDKLHDYISYLIDSEVNMKDEIIKHNLETNNIVNAIFSIAFK